MSQRPGFLVLAVLAATGLLVAGSACDGDIAQVQIGHVRVSNATTGGDPDRDGYQVFVDAQESESLTVGASAVLHLPSGVHLVELRGVASNCTVTGDNPRSVTIIRGETIDEGFAVHCVATGIQVVVTTSGLDPDPDGYFVKVDSDTPVHVAAGGSSFSVTYLTAGIHTVTLSGNAANCPMATANPMSVNVTTGVVAPASMQVACVAATGVLEVTAATSGVDPNPFGYTVQVDGGALISLGPNATVAIPGLAPGDHGLAVGGASANCTIAGNTPPIVTIKAGGTKRDTTRVAVAVTCTALTGAITVAVSGTGFDVDTALTLRLDAGPVQQFRIGTPFTWLGVSGGTHSVQLGDLAVNCAVGGSNPLSVPVSIGGAKRDTAQASFTLNCTANSGVVQVTVVTSGADLDLDGYIARLLDIGRDDVISINGTVTMPRVPLGDHFLGLGGAAANCTVGAPNPRTVMVTAGVSAPDTTRVTFAVSCVAFTGAIRVTNTTTGADLDANGYKVPLVGLNYSATADVPTNGSALVSRVPAGTYLVGTLGDAAINCDAVSGNPASVVVAVGDTAQLAVGVVCTPAALLAVQIDNNSGVPDIYSLKSNGQALVQLTSDPSSETEPAWSFDGTRIAYTANKTGNDEIWVMNADGTGRLQLTNDPQFDHHPTWSPSGSQIAFASRRLGNWDIWVMNADGSNAVRLTTNATDDIDPAWSPDGTRIAFASNRDGNFEIYVMNPDGTNQTRITQTPEDDVQPDWSPTSTQLVESRFTYCYYYYGCDYDLIVMNADGSAQVRLQTGSNDGAPAWSPDGRWIAFSASTCDYYYGCYSYGVMLIRPDGTGIMQLVPGSVYEPAWRR